MDKVPMLSLLAFFLSALSVRAIVEDTVATDFFILGDATFAGTGCSSRDVIVLLSSAHDGKDLLHLSFAQSFRAQSGATTKALRERETCNGVIPITPKSVRDDDIYVLIRFHMILTMIVCLSVSMGCYRDIQLELPQTALLDLSRYQLTMLGRMRKLLPLHFSREAKDQKFKRSSTVPDLVPLLLKLGLTQ